MEVWHTLNIALCAAYAACAYLCGINYRYVCYYVFNVLTMCVYMC